MFNESNDSIEWEFLIKALKSFNFDPSICKWFKTLYAESKSCVINNGHMSNVFNLERRCRQEDPISPYLFIIGVELLSCCQLFNIFEISIIFSLKFKSGMV
jgi:hypothetical protein